MKYTFRVTLKIDESTPISKEAVARMIREDVGSWQGSLPAEERIIIRGIQVEEFKKGR